MKRVTGFLTSASIVILLASPAAAVTARSSSTKLLQAIPGNIISTAFKVTNPDAPQDFVENIQIPDNWKLIMPSDDLFTAQTNASISRILAILVPSSTAAGTYTVTYEVSSRTVPSLRDTDYVKVDVAALSKVEIITVGPPKEVINGKEFNIDVRIVNRGNVAEKVTLLADSPSFFETAVTPKTLSIDPLSSAYATITVKTNGIAKESFEHRLNIKAVDAGKPEENVFDEKEVDTLITQNNSQTFDRFIRLPFSAKVVETGDTSRSATAIEMSGTGYINEEGTQKLDVLYRTPDVSGYSSFGTRDEYHVNFDSPALKLMAGDNSYDLTHLTDMSYFSRGVYVKGSTGNFDAAVFTGQTRFETTPKTHDAVQFNIRPAAGLNLSLQALRKNDTSSRVISLLGGYKKNNSEYCNVEVGVSDNTVTPSEKDNAYRIELLGRYPGSETRYMLESVYAGPQYAGYYSDQYFTNATLLFPVGSTDWTLSARKNNTNLSLVPERGAAYDELLLSAACLYPFMHETSLLLAVEDYKNADRTSAASFDVSQKTYKIGIEKKHGNFNIQANTGLINFKDNLSGTTLNDRMQYSVYSAYSPNRNLSLSLFGVYNNDIVSTTQEGSISLGGNLSFKRGGFFELNIGYSYTKTPSYPDYHSATLTSNFTMPNSNLLSLGGRWQRYSSPSRDELSFLATYSMTFDIPVGIRKDLGSLSGRLLDESGDIPVPAAGVKVFAGGYSAVTDKDGNYRFPYLKEGLYPMWVDNSGIGQGKVTSKKLPVVSVAKNAESNVDIALVNSCSLAGTFNTGTVNLPEKTDRNAVFVSGDRSIGLDAKDPSKSLDLAKLPVTLTNGEETLLTVTDENGRFEVSGLRPGYWIASYDKDALPSNYRIEDGTNTAELSQSGSAFLNVSLLPEMRLVWIIDSGVVGLPTVKSQTWAKASRPTTKYEIVKTEPAATSTKKYGVAKIELTSSPKQSKIFINTLFAAINVVKYFAPNKTEAEIESPHIAKAVRSRSKEVRYIALNPTSKRKSAKTAQKGTSFFSSVQESIFKSTDLLRKSLNKTPIKLASDHTANPE
ncbi:MAG: hypothetical protein WC527_05375 [Candidatus Margulisiibacteriota bacterium]